MGWWVESVLCGSNSNIGLETLTERGSIFCCMAKENVQPIRVLMDLVLLGVGRLPSSTESVCIF